MKTPKEELVNATLYPKTIHLKDGRFFVVRDLLKRRSRPINYNLLTGQVVRKSHEVRRPLKYTVEDRVWQYNATVQEISEKYNIDAKRAQHMKYQAKYVLESLDLIDGQK